MTDSLSSRIAKMKAVAPDANNIRIVLDGDGCEWRRERLWKVVQSLSVEHAAEIAWLEDASGTLRIGLRRGPSIAGSLLIALLSAWENQCECCMQLCHAVPIGGPEWCDVDNHAWDGSYSLTMASRR